MKRLEMFAGTAEKDDHKELYEQLGKCLRFGVCENSTYQTKVAEWWRFLTSRAGDEPLAKGEVDPVWSHVAHPSTSNRRRPGTTLSTTCTCAACSLWTFSTSPSKEKDATDSEGEEDVKTGGDEEKEKEVQEVSHVRELLNKNKHPRMRKSVDVANGKLRFRRPCGGRWRGGVLN